MVTIQMRNVAIIWSFVRGKKQVFVFYLLGTSYKLIWRINNSKNICQNFKMCRSNGSPDDNVCVCSIHPSHNLHISAQTGSSEEEEEKAATLPHGATDCSHAAACHRLNRFWRRWLNISEIPAVLFKAAWHLFCGGDKSEAGGVGWGSATEPAQRGDARHRLYAQLDVVSILSWYQNLGISMLIIFTRRPKLLSPFTSLWFPAGCIQEPLLSRPDLLALEDRKTLTT